MGNPKRKYDKEFKVEAVRLVLEEGRKVTEVANNLGIHENLLHLWKKKYLEDPEFSFPGKGYLKPRDEEIRQLKKRLSDAEQERDILKKALAVFSRGQK
jgi:transposase